MERSAREELTQLMPRVKAKAHSVLDNVKRKGAAAGDVMDAATEVFLWPQVLREAFAHEVVKMVKRVSSRQAFNRTWVAQTGVEQLSSSRRDLERC